MAATTVSLVLKEKLRVVGGKTEAHDTQVAGAYFNNENAISVAMDIFKSVLEDQSGKEATDEELAEYGGSNEDGYVVGYTTKDADADGFRVRVRTEEHTVGDVAEGSDEEYDEEDEEGDGFGGEEGAPAYPPASEGDDDDEFGGDDAEAGPPEGDEGEEEEEEEEAQPQKRKKM